MSRLPHPRLVHQQLAQASLDGGQGDGRVRQGHPHVSQHGGVLKGRVSRFEGAVFGVGLRGNREESVAILGILVLKCTQ